MVNGKSVISQKKKRRKSQNDKTYRDKFDKLKNFANFSFKKNFKLTPSRKRTITLAWNEFTKIKNGHILRPPKKRGEKKEQYVKRVKKIMKKYNIKGARIIGVPVSAPENSKPSLDKDGNVIFIGGSDKFKRMRIVPFPTIDFISIDNEDDKYEFIKSFTEKNKRKKETQINSISKQGYYSVKSWWIKTEDEREKFYEYMINADDNYLEKYLSSFGFYTSED